MKCDQCGQEVPEPYIPDVADVVQSGHVIQLSPKEREIVNLLKSSAPKKWHSRHLAERLEISKGSVRVFINHIRKSGVNQIKWVSTGGYYWDGSGEDSRDVPSEDIQASGLAGS